MTQASLSARPSVWSESLTLRGALLVVLLIALGLGALALWPARAWKPPPRPPLRAPIVFDEFVNAPSAVLTASDSQPQ